MFNKFSPAKATTGTMNLIRKIKKQFGRKLQEILIFPIISEVRQPFGRLDNVFHLGSKND